jgi:hypothetical protein
MGFNMGFTSIGEPHVAGKKAQKQPVFPQK